MSALVVSATFLQWFGDLPEQTLKSFTLVGITLSIIGFLYLTTDFFNRRVLANLLQIVTPMFLTAGFLAVLSSVLVLLPISGIYILVVFYTFLAGMIGVFHGVFVVPYHLDEQKGKQSARKTTRILTLAGRLRRSYRGIVTGMKSARSRISVRHGFRGIVTGMKSVRSRISVRRAFLGGGIGFLCLFLYALFAFTLVVILANLGFVFTLLYLVIPSAIVGVLGAVAGGIWRGFLHRSVQDEKHAATSLKDSPRPNQHASSHWSLPQLVRNVYHLLTDAPERPPAEKDEGLERQIKALVGMASTHPDHSPEQSRALEAAIQALLHTHATGQEQPAAIPARPPFFFKRDVKTGVFLWLGIFFFLWFYF